VRLVPFPRFPRFLFPHPPAPSTGEENLSSFSPPGGKMITGGVLPALLRRSLFPNLFVSGGGLTCLYHGYFFSFFTMLFLYTIELVQLVLDDMCDIRQYICAGYSFPLSFSFASSYLAFLIILLQRKTLFPSLIRLPRSLGDLDLHFSPPFLVPLFFPA